MSDSDKLKCVKCHFPIDLPKSSVTKEIADVLHCRKCTEEDMGAPTMDYIENNYHEEDEELL